MDKPTHRFKSREEVEKWIDDCVESGMATQLIYALIQKKTEELTEKKQFFLLKRREALVCVNTLVATELHLLMKECEVELRFFLDSLGSIAVSSKEVKSRIMSAETKEVLIEKLLDRIN